jgi:HAD superfamily hydrolase (TIGR01509 family)
MTASLPAAVLWDMDGTLLDSEKLWDIPLYELAERLGGALSLPTRQAMVGTNVPTTLDLLYADVGYRPDAEERVEHAQWIDKRMAEVLAESPAWRPGAQEALHSVRASGVPTALVTSTERELTEIALDTIGRELFDATVCGDEVGGRNKPLPEPYLRAARLLGVNAAQSVAIEDSPAGVASAVAAGCTVLVVPNDVPVQPGERRVFRDSLVGLTIDDLTRLLRLG